jgi:cytochrome c biogenesis protein CcmG/thiol:disulfide interchange protein DsbE
VPLEGKPAPDFQLQLFEGSTFRLAEQRGKPVVINFWASWCAPCRDEALLLSETATARPDVVFVGVNYQDRREDALAYLAEYRATYPNGADPRGAVSIDYGVAGVPETYFVDRSGHIVKKVIGPLTPASMQEHLQRISG